MVALKRELFWFGNRTEENEYHWNTARNVAF